MLFILGEDFLINSNGDLLFKNCFLILILKWLTLNALKNYLKNFNKLSTALALAINKSTQTKVFENQIKSMFVGVQLGGRFNRVLIQKTVRKTLCPCYHSTKLYIKLFQNCNCEHSFISYKYIWKNTKALNSLSACTSRILWTVQLHVFCWLLFCYVGKFY